MGYISQAVASGLVERNLPLAFQALESMQSGQFLHSDRVDSLFIRQPQVAEFLILSEDFTSHLNQTLDGFPGCVCYLSEEIVDGADAMFSRCQDSGFLKE